MINSPLSPSLIVLIDTAVLTLVVCAAIAAILAVRRRFSK